MLNISKNKLHLFLLVIITLVAGYLRFVSISDVPPGLYIDEISIAHNAHLIATSGIDEHGEKFPIFFEAFGEYKFPVYIYLVSLSEMLVGKGELAVRLPSALFGTLTVPILYLLTKISFKRTKIRKNDSLHFFPFIAAFLLAITPWHIHFSRAGFEANVALFFYLLAILFAFIYINSKKIWPLLFSVFLFALTTYTYQAYRLISPITILFFYILFYFKYKKSLKVIFLSGLLFIILEIPLIQFTFSQGGFSRFSQTSAFGGYDDKNFREKIEIFSPIFAKNYLSYFSPEFLFNQGDRIGRHQPPSFGLFYKWMFVLLPIGLYQLTKSNLKSLKKIIFFILIIAPLPASLAVPSPHSLRSLLLVAPFIIIFSFAVVFLLKDIRKKVILVFSFLLLGFAIWENIYYFRIYYIHYPKVNVLDWGAGKDKIVSKANSYSEKFDKIVAEETFSYLAYYAEYYTDNLEIEIVDNSWKKPEEWEGLDVLFIRADYKTQDNEKVFDKVRLDNTNNDVIAEFWKE